MTQDDATQPPGTTPAAPPDATLVLSSRIGAEDAESAAEQLEQIDAPEFARRFEFICNFASGGMGRISKARDIVFNRVVAVKSLKEPFNRDPHAIRAFIEECRLNARLDHPSIVPIYAMGRGRDGNWEAVMKLINGASLTTLIRSARAAEEKRALPFRQRRAAVISRLEYFLKACEVIEYCHSLKIVHGDIKPGNLLISQETGGLKLADLGLARVSGSKSGEDIMATPLYAAPEVIRGEKSDFGVRSDLYSFGVMLYELLCGSPPFVGSPEKVLEQHLYSTPQPLLTRNPDLDPKLVAFVEKLMDKDPEKRPASWAEVREFFSSMLADSEADSGAAIQAIISSERKRKSFRIVVVWFFLLLVLAVLGAVLFLVIRLQQLEPEPIHASPLPSVEPGRSRQTTSPSSSGALPDLSVRLSSEPAVSPPSNASDSRPGSEQTPPPATRQPEKRAPRLSRRGKMFDPPVSERVLQEENQRVQRLFTIFRGQIPESWRKQADQVLNGSHRLLLQLRQAGMESKRIDRLEFNPNEKDDIARISNGPVSGTLIVNPNVPPIRIARALGEGLFEANSERLGLPRDLKREFGEAFAYFVEQRLAGKATPNPGNRVLVHCRHSLPLFVLMLQNRNMQRNR